MDASDKKILKPKQQGPADISEPMLESHLFPGAAATVPEGSEEDEIHSCTTPRGSNIFSESGPGESSISQAEAATVMEVSDKKILKPSREENLVVKQQGHVDNSELLLESYLFPEAAATVPEGSEADEIHPHTTPRGSNIFFESELGFCSLLPLTVYSSAPNLSFNKDCCCFATGTDYNFKIYSCEPFREIFLHDFDHSGIGAVKMNKVMIWDDHKRQCFGELTFQSEVCGVQLRWDRIVVVLEQKISIYNFADLKLVHQIETISNPKGLCAVSHAAESIILVCPGLHKGRVRVELYASKRTQFITAHNSRIACFVLTQDGQLLATCSSKGTLVRIFNTVDGSLLQEVKKPVLCMPTS